MPRRTRGFVENGISRVQNGFERGAELFSERWRLNDA